VKRSPDIDQSASNFCNVCGVMAGFTSTFVVLLLTPNLLSNTQAQDNIIAVFLLAGMLYINGAAILGNIPRITTTVSVFAFNLGIGSFHLANVFFAYAFNLLLDGFSLSIASLVAKGFTMIAVIAFAVNFLSPANIRSMLQFLHNKRKTTQ
jgi:hypothetical protein